MSFVFTVSSFCTSAPEEREEKPRNRAFGYVAKSDALQGKGEDDFRRRSFEKEAFCRARPKSPRGVLAKEMIPGCERKCEQRLAGGGGESRSERKPSSGDREKGQGPCRRKARTGSNRTPRGRLVQGRAKLRPATPPQRHLRDSRRPTCTRAAANLGVPLPQQVRCRGAHRATNARLAERAQA